MSLKSSAIDRKQLIFWKHKIIVDFRAWMWYTPKCQEDRPLDPEHWQVHTARPDGSPEASQEQTKKVLDKRLPMWYNPTCQDGKRIVSINSELKQLKFLLTTARKCDILQNVKRRYKPPRKPQNWTENQNKKLCGARRGTDHWTRRTYHADGITESGRGDSSRRGPDTTLAVWTNVHCLNLDNRVNRAYSGKNGRYLFTDAPQPVTCLHVTLSGNYKASLRYRASGELRTSVAG